MPAAAERHVIPLEGSFTAERSWVPFFPDSRPAWLLSSVHAGSLPVHAQIGSFRRSRRPRSHPRTRPDWLLSAVHAALAPIPFTSDWLLSAVHVHLPRILLTPDGLLSAVHAGLSPTSVHTRTGSCPPFTPASLPPPFTPGLAPVRRARRPPLVRRSCWLAPRRALRSVYNYALQPPAGRFEIGGIIGVALRAGRG